MSTPYSYIIAEDEPLLARALAQQLNEHWPAARCSGLAANGIEALKLAEEFSPDVAFLDVRMPQLDGLEAAQQLCLKDNPPLIVFVTAYDAYALDAFETAAIDYLLKPVEAARLGKCIERLCAQLGRGGGDAGAGAGAGLMAERIAELLGTGTMRKDKLRFVRAGAGTTVKLIPVNDVLWFEAEDKYITVATCEGDSIIRMPLRELLEQLDAEVFWQIHRGTVVNSAHIALAKRNELGHLSLTLKGRKEEIAVSRQFAHLFKQM
ncbi:MAG TPA: LytTR family DNA-binding domain-containing protein [Steroidobacteraceae bacterium]|jgi:DNA-binding LytR/AlgR family response regulator|nr:LytTR family DNA-binding domain-containing protein [Steroidobacteraceae bacterium]